MVLLYLLVMTVAFVWLVVSYNRSMRKPLEPTPEPQPVASDRKIKQLEEWNVSWIHPELGEFYHWSEKDRAYVEGPAPGDAFSEVRVTEGHIPTFKPEKWKRDDPDLPLRAKRNVERGVAGCRCDKLPEGMICSQCFFL